MGRAGEPLHCVVCSEEVLLLSITPCNHSLCHVCFLRIHANLCDPDCDICKIDTSCGFCRAPYDGCIFSRKEAPYGLFPTSTMLRDKKLNAYFESKEDMDLVNDLLRPACSVCQEKFPTPNKLKEHLRKTHDVYLCDICTAHTRKFHSEYTLYTRKDLLVHFRQDLALNLKEGHPLCQYCDLRLYDNDHLHRHMHTVHVHCGLCHRLGNRHQFCPDQPSLRQHYRDVHVVCDHPDCIDIAFANDVELRGHMAKEHMQGASRSKARQALALDVNFFFEDRGRNARRNDRATVTRDAAPVELSEEEQLQRALARSMITVDTSTHFAPRPAAAAAPPPPPSAPSASAAAAAAVQRGPGPGFAAASGSMASTVSSRDHFPALAAETTRLGPVRSNYSGVMGGGGGGGPSSARAASPPEPATASSQPTARAAPGQREYILLADAKERNTTLIKEVTRILGRGPALDRFKTQSAAFRKGELSPADYCHVCRTLLANYFDEAFAELITLLPDIKQQRALLAACRAQSSAAWGAAAMDLVECHCGQVMRRSDLAGHAQNHDASFPTLPTTAKPRTHFVKAKRGGRA